MEEVILINESGEETGIAEKLAAHREGLLHRAFSIFLVDESERLLLQRRSPHKYHSAGLWANSACGHPRPGEATGMAATRRLGEELGVRVDLFPSFRACYREPVGPDMTENEQVDVFFGRFSGEPEPDQGEVDAVDWVTLPQLALATTGHPGRYTVWLRHYLDRHYDDIEDAISSMNKGNPSFKSP